MNEHARESQPLPREIAVRFIPVIRKIASRLATRLPRHICVDDLTGAGFIGLVDAYRRFDPSVGKAFETFAEFRIRGAMLDELRQYDPLSRDLRKHVKRAGAATAQLHAQLGRAPREDELARELGLPIEQLRTYAARAEVGQSVSLDAGAEDGEPQTEVGDAKSLPADEQLQESRARRKLEIALEALPPRLRQILDLYHGDDLTLRAIGGILGITESRVSQLHSEAVRRLKERCASTWPAPVAARAPFAAHARSRARPRRTEPAGDVPCIAAPPR